MKKIYSLTCSLLLIGSFAFTAPSSALSEKVKPEPVTCDKYVILIGDHGNSKGEPLIDEELLQCYHQRLEQQGNSVITVSIAELMRNPIEDNPSTQYCYILFGHGSGKSNPYKVKIDPNTYVEISDVIHGLPGTPTAVNLFTCQSGEAAKCDALSCSALFCSSPSWEDLHAHDLNDWLKAVCDGTIKASGDPSEIFENWRPKLSGLQPFGGYQYPNGAVGGKIDSISEDYHDPRERPAPPPVAPPVAAPPVFVIPK